MQAALTTVLSYSFGVTGIIAAGTVFALAPLNRQQFHDNTLSIVDIASRPGAAIGDCIHQQSSGQFRTNGAVVSCSNRLITAAYENAGYRYMDLVLLVTAKRLQLSAAMDQGNLSDQQSQQIMAQFMAQVAERERQRDRGQK